MDTVEEGDVPSAESEGRYAYVVTDLRELRNGLSLLPGTGSVMTSEMDNIVTANKRHCCKIVSNF
jgi:hypothetical protein